MKILSIFLFITVASLSHTLEFFECDESKGNGFQPTDCTITGVRLSQSSMEKYAFSPKALMNSVRFVNSKLTHLPQELFKQMPMQTLFVEGVSLKELTPFTFNLASELLELHAANNNIRKIIKNTFYGVEKLRLVDLANNALEHVDSDAFLDLTSLRWISLANNNLRVLDPEWFMSSNAFVHINMKHNRFDSVELDLGDKISLTDLDLSGREGVGSPMKEVSLQLNCTYLKNLDVSHNTNLQQFKVMCYSRGLQDAQIYAHDTSLGVGASPSLMLDPLLNTYMITLDKTLHFNMEELSSLGSLRGLSLEQNSYKRLNIALSKLKYLEKLSLKGSGAKAVDISIINEMKNLRSLNLAENGLTSFDVRSFNQLEYLTELNLAGNLLTTLQVGLFFDLFPSLEFFDITDNRFSSETLEELIEAFNSRGIVVNY